jgi:signal transduction histidine kinase
MGLGQLTSPLPENQPDEIGQLSLAFNEMVQRVETRELEIRELSKDLSQQSKARGVLLKRLITAQENERKRVAREIHDELGQVLAALALRIEATKKLITSKPEKAGTLLEQTQGLVNDASERMYSLIMALRPSVLDDLGLEAALRSHAEILLRDTDITFELNATQLKRRLSPELEIGLYRVFQEALSNVVRHAGAHKVTILLAQTDGYFHGEIEDDGRGFDPQAVRLNVNDPKGLGLLGMHERVTQLGGQIEIRSKTGGGTCIEILVPMEKDNYA